MAGVLAVIYVLLHGGWEAEKPSAGGPEVPGVEAPAMLPPDQGK